MTDTCGGKSGDRSEPKELNLRNSISDEMQTSRGSDYFTQISTPLPSAYQSYLILHGWELLYKALELLMLGFHHTYDSKIRQSIILSTCHKSIHMRIGVKKRLVYGGESQVKCKH